MLHVDVGTEGEYEFPGDDAPAMDAAGNVVTPAFSLLDVSVEVMDQAPGEGNTVVVPLAAAETAGWLVVHAEGDEGGPGPVIGFAPGEGGLNRNVEVELDAEGLTETVYAMLHVDAGEAGAYEFPGPDAPARDDADNVVVLPFALKGVTMSDEAMTGDASIAVGDGSYLPGELTVTAGTTVTWEYNGSGGHTVTADDGSFDTGNMSGGDTFSFTFDEPGEYPYYCTYHGGPGGQGMSGIVIVTES